MGEERREERREGRRERVKRGSLSHTCLKESEKSGGSLSYLTGLLKASLAV